MHLVCVEGTKLASSVLYTSVFTQFSCMNASPPSLSACCDLCSRHAESTRQHLALVESNADLLLQDACAKLKSLSACEGPRVQPKQVGKYRRARRPSDPAVVSEAGAKCVT